VPEGVTEQPAKVTTPAAAVFERPPVQVSVPEPFRASVTLVVLSLVTVALEEVCTATTGCAASALPATPAPGCVVNASFAALAVIVKVTGVTDVPPPGAGVTTVTLAVPAVAMSAAPIVAVSWLVLTKLVVRATPFHCTVDVPMKLVPFTVSVKPAPPAVADEGLMLVVVGAGLVADGPVTSSVKLPVTPW
jgi:hypothetical protein